MTPHTQNDFVGRQKSHRVRVAWDNRAPSGHGFISFFEKLAIRYRRQLPSWEDTKWIDKHIRDDTDQSHYATTSLVTHPCGDPITRPFFKMAFRSMQCRSRLVLQVKAAFQLRWSWTFPGAYKEWHSLCCIVVYIYSNDCKNFRVVFIKHTFSNFGKFLQR